MARFPAVPFFRGVNSTKDTAASVIKLALREPGIRHMGVLNGLDKAGGQCSRQLQRQLRPSYHELLVQTFSAPQNEKAPANAEA